jgi:hypothetical protein
MRYGDIELTTRTPQGGLGHMMRVVQSIATMYEVSAGLLVKSIYEDDKNCALYTVDLDPTMPEGWAADFAHEIDTLFCELGGYNGLEISLRGKTILSCDPWWAGDDRPILRVIQGGRN